MSTMYTAMCPSGMYLSGLVLDVASTADAASFSLQYMVNPYTIVHPQTLMGVSHIICQKSPYSETTVIPVPRYVAVGKPFTMMSGGKSLVNVLLGKNNVMVSTQPSSQNLYSTSYVLSFRDILTGETTLMSGFPASNPIPQKHIGRPIGAGISFMTYRDQGDTQNLGVSMMQVLSPGADTPPGGHSSYRKYEIFIFIMLLLVIAVLICNASHAAGSAHIGGAAFDVLGSSPDFN